VRVVPAYRGLDLGAVLAGEDGFADKRPRFRRFVPEHFQGVTSLTSARFPFLLTSFRSPYQFLTGEATAHSTTLARFPGGPCCYLNPGDAARLGVAEGQPVRVASAVDALEAPARLSEEVPPGVVGMHFHFRGLLMNKLFPTQFDARTFTPNFKVVAVRVEPAAADAGAQAEGVEAVPARGPAAATAGAPAAAATASTAATDAKAASAAQGPAGPGPTASAGAASPASARPGRRG
jgi:predicted molibdopterin-dependent oxidoreductase YjgC